MQYQLTDTEKERMKKAVATVLSIPFIDDLEDFIWEAVFSYSKGLPVVDPLTSIRSKRLFDIVDGEHKIGWSAKAVQWAFRVPCTFELVIQRADIFKKAEALGFSNLTKETSPAILGKALMKHWIDEKVKKDAEHQGVSDKRVCILLKSRNRKRFAYIEESLVEYDAKDLDWHWTDDSKTGLQGIRRSDNARIFRWYPNQKQLFETFHLTEDAFTFELDPRRLPMGDTVDLLFGHLGKP